MKIVHLSTSSTGGAGIAALRLHRMLLDNNINSHFLSRNKPSSHNRNCYELNEVYHGLPRVKTIANNYLEKTGSFHFSNSARSQKYLQNKPHGFEYFSFPYSNLYIESCEIVKTSDIIHLHWIAEDFVNYPTFFTALQNKKLVWTLHDMNPFTGGCHHADGCTNYKTECFNCPQLPAYSKAETAYKAQQLKLSLYSKFGKSQLKIVAPSQWLLEKSRSSACFNSYQHHKISNPVDHTVFTPTDKQTARTKLGLPPDKKIILFVSHSITNERKGTGLLQEAVKKNNDPDLLLCAAGNEAHSNDYIYNLGYIADDVKMALAYSAADVFILPSFAENFPNTIVESLLCGTPVIATATGGIPEQVTNDSILLHSMNVHELARAIKNIVRKYETTVQTIRNEAILKFSASQSIQQYISLYSQLLKA
jgi:glycosyltransferase involved in cell wall biosynthesis